MARYKPEYRCPHCDGQGQRECECCHINVECDVCWGTGLNAAVVDVEAYKAAYRELVRESRFAFAWFENGVMVGMENPKGDRLAVADFVRKQTTEKNHE